MSKLDEWTAWLDAQDAKHPEMHEQDALITFPEMRLWIATIKAADAYRYATKDCHPEAGTKYDMARAKLEGMK